MHNLYCIPVFSQQCVNLVFSDHMSCMTGHQELWLQSPNLINGIDPLHEISVWRTSDRIQVWEGFVDDICTKEGIHAGDVHPDLVICFSWDVNQLYIKTWKFLE